MRAAARVMRLVDDRAPEHVQILKDLHPHVGRAYVLGVTGTPGAGKSTLVDRLIAAFRAEGKKVGVVAVDPTSPFSGGSILGDRIRMQRHFLDEGVFIRSVATRGALGGLSKSATDVVRVLDAFGCDVILVETVGVGQDELEITRTAHTSIVVVTPGAGDDVQASKAGILEIADIFVVNKADRDGADAQVRHLESMIALGKEISRGTVQAPPHHGHVHAPSSVESLGVDQVRAGDPAIVVGDWTPPIVKTVAARGEGIDLVLKAIESHRAFLTTDEGKRRRQKQLHDQLVALFRDTLTDLALGALQQEIEEAARAVSAGGADPYSACEALVAQFKRGTAG